jgi:hypothetical protein
LSVGDLLFAISEAGLTFTASKSEDTLKVYLAERLTADLAKATKEHKAGIIRIMREDEEMRRTGIIQSECQKWVATDSFAYAPPERAAGEG